jgi:long-chain acyl-CoA synthetase
MNGRNDAGHIGGLLEVVGILDDEMRHDCDGSSLARRIQEVVSELMLTIGDTITHATRRFGAQTCVVCDGPHDGDDDGGVGDGGTYTYDQFDERCRRLVSALQQLGLKPGDRVAVLALNCHRYLECFVGLPAGGFVFVALNTRLSEPELASIIDDCLPRVLLTDRSPEAIGSLAAKFERVIQWPDEFETLLAASEPAPFPSDISPESVAALFYTGGTTGRSKGVMLSHANIVANTFHKTITVGFRVDDVFLAAPAMFHVAGVAPLLSLLTLGARTVIVPGFDPVGVLDAIKTHGVTIMMPVPTMLSAMIVAQRANPREIPSLRMLGHAASPMSVAGIKSAVATFPGVEIAQFYGATETASIVTCQHHEEQYVDTSITGTCGQPAVGVSVRIVDAAGKAAPVGEIGEVVVQGRNVMAGYWNNPEATADVLQDGWYRTGDLGYVNETDHLFLVDRAKDMIITGAENVYSFEVEDVLYRFEGILEVAVFGIPHEKWGEAVHAVVVSNRTDMRAGDLSSHCRESLAGYKVPKTFDIRAEPLPKSGPGKILKRALRDPFWAETGTSI